MRLRTDIFNILLILILFLLSLIVYWGIWDHPLTGKDFDVFREIPHKITDLPHYIESQPHTPLSFLLIILSEKLGVSINIHYFINWLLHTLNGIILFILLIHQQEKILNKLIAFLLCILFLLHPFSIYSTAFLIHRGGILGVTFSVFTLLTLQKYTKRTFTTLGLILLCICTLLSISSHYLTVGLCIAICLYLLIKHRDESNIPISTYVIPLFIFNAFIILTVSITLWNKLTNLPLFSKKPNGVDFLSQIANFYFLSIYPTSYFPINDVHTEVILGKLIAIILLFGFLTSAVYSYIVRNNILLISSTIVLLLSIILPLFAHFDLHINNSYYLLFFSLVYFIYLLLQSTFNTSYNIRSLFIGVLIIFASFIGYLGYHLIQELKSPEELWLACVANNKNNPDGWLYLAREYTNKAFFEREEPKRSEYIEKAQLFWDGFLEISGTDVEGFQNKARLSILSGKYEEASELIQRAVNTNPLNMDTYKIKIDILKEQVNRENKREYLNDLFNCYVLLLNNSSPLAPSELNNFVHVAEQTNNIDMLCDILEKRYDEISKYQGLTCKVKDLPSLCKEIQDIKRQIPYPLLNSGEHFSPPFEHLTNLHERKKVVPLYISWLNYQLLKNKDSYEPVVKMGRYYGSIKSPQRFIQIWGSRIVTNEIWERIARECIMDNNFESAEVYMNQTWYSPQERFLKLSKYATEAGNHLQSDIWQEKAKQLADSETTNTSE